MLITNWTMMWEEEFLESACCVACLRCLCVYASVCISVCLCVYLSVCVCGCLSMCVRVCVFVKRRTNAWFSSRGVESQAQKFPPLFFTDQIFPEEFYGEIACGCWRFASSTVDLLFSREDVNIPESHNRQSLRRRLLFLPLHSATSSSFVLGNEGRYRNLMRKVS